MTKGVNIELKDVELNNQRINKKLNLYIHKKSFNLIIGPNGAGKSTLLNLIAGFRMPQKGQIIINNIDMTHTPPNKRPISMIFQDNNLFLHLSVKKNIELGCSKSLFPSVACKKRVTEALERTNLTHYAQKTPNQLSGGERQRVAIARCLVRQEPILLLDEPFSSLDSSMYESMLDLIKELHQTQKMTLLLIAHNLRNIKKIADTIILIENGIVKKEIHAQKTC